MNYFELFPSDLLNLLLSKLDYNDLNNLIESKIIEEYLIDWKYLLYNNASEYKNMINTYEIENLLPGLSIPPCNSLHKIFYGLILYNRSKPQQFNKHKYILYNREIGTIIYSYIDELLLLFKINPELLGIIIKNKNFINVAEKCYIFNIKVELKYVDLKFFVDVCNNKEFYIEDLFKLCYISNINEITDILFKSFEVIALWSELVNTLEYRLVNKIIRDYLCEYIKYLIMKYPKINPIMDIINDHQTLIVFAKVNRFDVIDTIIEKVSYNQWWDELSESLYDEDYISDYEDIQILRDYMDKKRK